MYWTAALCFFLFVGAASGARKALIVDGQNNHKWQETTPLLKKMLEDSMQFRVEVATSPPRGADMSAFKPDFAAFDVIVLNYNGEAWAPGARSAFVEYVRRGGGLVIVHASDNSFANWKEYNQMAGLGGWGGRDEKWGPYVRVRGRRIILDTKMGVAGHHGKRHPFQVVARDTHHPILRGLPPTWMHAQDELYDSLRGPAAHMAVLATAYSDPASGGSGEKEPTLMVLRYGKGRIFHTTLGHDATAMKCVGFIVTLQRGAEWAATGKVTQKKPLDFPGPNQTSTRE